MIVVIDICANSCVVVVPLSLCNGAISVLISEARQEFHKHLIFGHLPTCNLWVFAAVKNGRQICRSDYSVSWNVKFLESCINNLLTLCIWAATNCNEEFVKWNNTVLIGVKCIKKALRFSLGNTGAKVLQALIKFLLVNLAVSVVIKDRELLAHASDGLAASCLQVSAHFIENYSKIRRKQLQNHVLLWDAFRVYITI